jgi:thiamine pyrophosphate-dependent acetolactate synthase large subunit-like protein
LSAASSDTTQVFDILAESFHREGVSDCFALLGDANMNWASRLADRGCRMVYVRHEHCAVAAAMAYARKQRNVGVATVTCGPGVTQLMTALPAAVRANLPLVVFAGESPLKAGWYNQELDQGPMVRASGAHYISLHHVDRMPVAVRDAFLTARREQTPVVIGVPFDLQNLPWTSDKPMPPSSLDLMVEASPVPPHPDDVARASHLFNDASRVVVLAGFGAVLADAGPACRALAEKTGGLLATTLPARGLFHNDPYCVGIAGSFSTEAGLEYLAQADLVVTVGGSQAIYAGGGGQLWPNATMLHVDIDPASTSQGQVVARNHLRADARLGVEALTDAVPASSKPWRSPAIADAVASRPADTYEYPAEPGLHDPRDVVTALEEALPANWEMVNSSGHCSGFFAQMPSRAQEHFLTIREFGAIGNGSSFAMGVAAARPDSPVVLFDGDGSLMMHIQELETMLRHEMKVLIVVMNDGAYGSEIHKLRSEGMPDTGAVFGHTDFAAIARGFGLVGETITDLSALPALVDAFAKGTGPAVWNFPVSDKVQTRIMRQAHG